MGVSEFRRQIAFGSVVAVLLALGLGLGAGYYFPSTAQGTTVSSAVTSTFVATSTAVTSVAASRTVSSATQATTAMTTTATSVQTTSLSSVTATVTSSASPTISSISTCTGCPELQIVSANLTVSGKADYLSVSLRNAGTDNASGVSIALGAVPLVMIPEVSGGQQTWVSVQLPPGLPVQAGRSYQVTVRASIGPTIMETSVSVVAESA